LLHCSIGTIFLESKTYRENALLNYVALEERRGASIVTMALLGDPWTLRILRECFLNVRRIEAFELSLEISRSHLSERLNALVSLGLLRRSRYEETPRRYEFVLTEKGFDYRHIVLSVCPLKYAGSTELLDRRASRTSRERRTIFDGITVCPDCAEVLASEMIPRGR
jgi:DNA-binding HxlR family transcriptional regulator